MPRKFPYDVGTFRPPAPVVTVKLSFDRKDVFEIALIDTGSDITTLTNHVVRTLGLNPIGEIPVIGATGTSALSLLYLANLDFLGKRYRNHGLALLNVSYMLIGRDILNDWVTTFDGPKLMFRLGFTTRTRHAHQSL